MGYKPNDPWEPWFRGQEKDDWHLKPTLYRQQPPPGTKLREMEDEIRKMEDEIREEFIKRAPILSEFSPAADEKRAEWEWYFMMQHYRAATRLLDWTDGALIALYYAVKDNCGASDAAVWVLDPYELNKPVFPRLWVIPPSATGLDPKVREQLKKWLPERFPKKYKPLPRRAVAIEPTHVVQRMSSQHSCFTIHGSDRDALDDLERGSSRCLFKIVIPRWAVKEIEKDLRRCGIDESTIFPDLDGLGRSINKRWGIGKGCCPADAEGMPHHGVYTRLRPSNIHGVGVFAIRDIPEGTRIFQDDDSELIWKKRSELNLDELPQEIGSLYDQFCLIKEKGETYGCPKSFNLMTVAWYLNHSKTPNVGCDKDYMFFALRDIKKGEELTADYHTYNGFASADWV